MEFNKDQKANYIVAIGLISETKKYLNDYVKLLESGLENYNKKCNEEDPTNQESIDILKTQIKLVKEYINLADVVLNLAGFNVVLCE
ncbi:MAG: hypothetical protein II978_03090 [Clostridia bacterium]|nr:hypothetical protein [Clostridia bacterium]